MSLPSDQIKLISDALKTISDKKNQEFLFNLLVQYAEKNEWFSYMLISTLQRGVTFNLNAIDGTVAQYLHKNTKISIHSQLFKKKFPQELLIEALIIVLRHEFTHAFDQVAQAENNYLFQSLLNIAIKVAATLFQELNCIRRSSRVNTTTLDKLSSVIYQNSDRMGQLRIVQTVPESKQSDIYLKNLGSMSGTSIFGNAYIVGLWNDNGEIGGIELREMTVDPVYASKLYNITLPSRQKNGFQTLEKDFFLDSHLFDLFSFLSKKQRQILNALFITQTSIHDNLRSDSFCYPKMEKCIKTAGNDCLDIFLQCQSADNPEHLGHSVSEIHASLSERFDIHILKENIFPYLCLPSTPTPTSTPISTPKISSPPLDEKKPTSALAIVENPVTPKETSSLSQLALHTGLSSVGSSFVNQIAQSYGKEHELSDPDLFVLAADLTYVSLVGLYRYLANDVDSASFALTVTAPVIFALLHKILLPTGNSFINHTITALIFTTQAAANDLPTSLTGVVSGMIGSGIGRALGDSFSSWMWGRDKSTEQVENEMRVASPGSRLG